MIINSFLLHRSNGKRILCVQYYVLQTCARIYLFRKVFLVTVRLLQYLFLFQTSNGTADSANNKQQHAQPATVVVQPKQELKPVECNLCHRRFKNVPALNGHMRLHGGYFKKVRNFI